MAPQTAFDTLLEQATGPAAFATTFMDHLGLAGIFERMDIAEDETPSQQRQPENKQDERPALPLPHAARPDP